MDQINETNEIHGTNQINQNRLEAGGKRSNDKWENPNVKAQSSKGAISGRTEKRALSANQRFFRRVSGMKDCLRRFLQ
jgi:hypothetical protein